MATIVHNDFRNAQLGNPTHSTVDFNADTLKLALCDALTSGTIAATFVDYDEVDGGAIGTNPTITSGSITIGTVATGVFDSSGVPTWTSLSGNQVEYLVLYKDSGAAATSPLILTFDSATTGLPLTPNGGDVTVTWSGSGILQI